MKTENGSVDKMEWSFDMSRRFRICFVLSSPSGGGKTTILNEAIRRMEGVRHSVSFTTRKIRDEEEDGVDYCFTDEATFKQKIINDDFIEWAVVHGHYYGTDKQHLQKMLEAGSDVLLDIDTVGAGKLKKEMPHAVLVFICPPSQKVLERRLRERDADAERDIAIRLNNADMEVNEYAHYDYMILNDDLEKAVRDMMAIITAERLKVSRLKDALRRPGV